MKSNPPAFLSPLLGSHPSRGAWIEMCLPARRPPLPGRRTPHGVRGLKSLPTSIVSNFFMSHPSRGAWIEIRIFRGMQVLDLWSHPSRGAWIEIFCTRLPVPASLCRTPHGVRGLKYLLHHSLCAAVPSHPSRGAWIEIFFCCFLLSFDPVAPLTGCVD